MVLGHQCHGLRSEHLGALEAAVVQQHLQKGEIVRSRRIKWATPRPEFGSERPLQRLGHEGAIGLALMYAGLANALLCRGDVAAAFHAEWPEDLVTKIGVERLPADCFDKATYPFDVDAVLPFVAGIGDQRHAYRRDLAGCD